MRQNTDVAGPISVARPAQSARDFGATLPPSTHQTIANVRQVTRRRAVKKPVEVLCVVAMICATTGVLRQTMRSVIDYFRADWNKATLIEVVAREPESSVDGDLEKRWKVVINFTAQTDDGVRFSGSRSVGNGRYADQAKALAAKLIADRSPIWFDRNEPNRTTFDPNGDQLKYGAFGFVVGIFILGEFAVLLYVIFRRHDP